MAEDCNAEIMELLKKQNSGISDGLDQQEGAKLRLGIEVRNPL